ncbi:hypothetical protein VNO78_10821 [Psophocarpus tetragonolobus]|uniref:Uncharacterized protein n=1 Tax=Psophocarpus tetragonolobus TaxID=3891 RepID=A0AAN9SS87_PSOTE
MILFRFLLRPHLSVCRPRIRDKKEKKENQPEPAQIIVVASSCSQPFYLYSPVLAVKQKSLRCSEVRRRPQWEREAEEEGKKKWLKERSEDLKKGIEWEIKEKGRIGNTDKGEC